MALPKSVCDNCVNTECLWRAPTGGKDPPVMICPAKIDKPQTNYDRIVSKTPEELAKYFRFVVDCEFCPVVESARECTDGKYCMERWLDWLKQEATE